MTVIEKPGFCTLCRSRCGTINVVDGDALIAVKPDLAHPTGKAICMKGKAAPELVHSPHRLLYPQRRTNPKGAEDPGWVRITWDEALDEIASRLLTIREESGAEAVAFATATPSGTSLSDSIDWIDRLINHFGSPNTISSTEVCNWHRDHAHRFTFGCDMPPADYAYSDLILLWGHNPTHTWLSQSHAIAAGRARGARMIVVDPRPTALAKEADVWLQVRPGTDAAVAMGLINLLIRNDGFDQRFVREWTNAPMLVRSDTGLMLREQDVWPRAEKNRLVVWHQHEARPRPFDADTGPCSVADDYALRATVDLEIDGGVTVSCSTAFELLAVASAAYDEHIVEKTTGVPVAQLRAAATLLGQSRRIGYHSWTGLAQHTNATQAERATAVLYALTGSFDVVGGNRVRSGPPSNKVGARDALPLSQRVKTLGLDDRPIGPPAIGRISARDAYRAMLEGAPYKLRALFGFGTNLLVSLADTALATQALGALEFHVHCDLFETPTMRFADIVLPVNTSWEREGLRIGFDIDDAAEGHIQLRQRMVSPRGESWSDTDIVFALASRMGLKEQFFDGDIEAGWNHMLAPTALSTSDLRLHPGGLSYGLPQREKKYARQAAHESGQRVKGFGTESGRVELYSELLLRHGQPPLPEHVEPAESPLDASRTRSGRFPYVLSSVKNGYYCHSQMRSLSSLRKRAPLPIVEISPTTAQRHDLTEGDWARINTRMGSARFVVRITPTLADSVVMAEYGWWQGCDDLGLGASNAIDVSSGAGSNFNMLVSADERDPVSGSVAHRSFLCDIERDALTAQRQRRWSGYRSFTIAALTPECGDVMRIEFTPTDGAALPDYLPGQHIIIRLRVADGSTVTRAYSLTGACAVDGRNHFAIAVRHQRSDAHEGIVSSHFHGVAQLGDHVEIGFPSGNFTMPGRTTLPIVMAAAGIGITPFMSLLASLETTDEQTELVLIYANRNSTTHAFKRELAAYKERHPNFRVVNHYTRPTPENIRSGNFDSTERLTAAAVSDDLIRKRARVYLCGPTSMMEEMTAGLRARGMPAADIFSEVFRSPARHVPDSSKNFLVTFLKSASGSKTWTAADGTLLAFGEKLGVQLSSGCRVGQCESCAVKIVSGKARHLHGAEPEDPNTCLLCQAVPTEDMVIDA